MGKIEEDFEYSIFLEAQKYYFAFEWRLNFFWNGYICNVVSTLPNVLKIDVENDNIVSTLSNAVRFNVEIHNVVSTLSSVVNFNVDVHNVVSTLIWRCGTSRRHINLKPTLNRRWNICWAMRNSESSILFQIMFFFQWEHSTGVLSHQNFLRLTLIFSAFWMLGYIFMPISKATWKILLVRLDITVKQK